jgi:hypothetical protein
MQLRRAPAMKTLIALVIIAAEALAVSACSLDAYPCRGPYGEPCGSARSGWPGATTCANCEKLGVRPPTCPSC